MVVVGRPLQGSFSVKYFILCLLTLPLEIMGSLSMDCNLLRVYGGMVALRAMNGISGNSFLKDSTS